MRTRFVGLKQVWSLLTVAAAVAVFAIACGGSDDPTAAPPPAASTPTPVPTAMPSAMPSPTAAPSGATAVPTAAPSGATAAPTAAPVATAAPATAAPVPPPPTEVDFSGKTIQITVGYAPGGGFDTFARIFAAHLTDELPGNPSVFVSNKPGANTLVAVKSVTGKDYRDNQVDIVLVISSLIQQSILSGSSEFDAANDLHYLGAPDYTPSDQTWCIRSDVADTLDGYFAGNYTLGQIGRVDTYATSTEWAVQVGFPFNRVFNYLGTSDMDRGFNSREIEITPTCRDSQVLLNPEWAEGYATPLFYTNVEPEWVKAGKAEGKWAWVTSIRDIAENRLGASQAYLTALDVLLDASSANRVFAMPTQTPTEIVDAMRAAFERVVLSPEFVADMKSRAFDVGLRGGDQYQAQVEEFANLPDETLTILRGLFPQ